jgi:hypothetical protein
MKSIIDTYNDSSHRGLDNKTPNEVFNNQDNQLARHLSDTVHNHNIYKSVPFKENDKVRVIEEKGKFDKGKQKFSKFLFKFKAIKAKKNRINLTTGQLSNSVMDSIEVINYDLNNPQSIKEEISKIRGAIKNNMIDLKNATNQSSGLNKDERKR